MDKSLLTLMIALFLWGCATPYEAYNIWSDGGFDEVQLDENSWRVSFKGTGFDDKERIADLCLLRCAELSLQNGYRYFAIISKQNTEESEAYVSPSYSQTNVIGNTAYTHTYGGQLYFSSSPSSSNEIICFRVKPEDIYSYNAEFLINSIKTKYEIQ